MVRPRFWALRRIPRADTGETKYFGGAMGSSTSVRQGEQEHPSSPLGHSEVLRVEDPPRHAIPEVCQGVEDDAHVDAAVRAEQTGNVLHENGSGSKSRDDPVELVPESGALPREPGAASCDADILAGKPSGDEIRGAPRPAS